MNPSLPDADAIQLGMANPRLAFAIMLSVITLLVAFCAIGYSKRTALHVLAGFTAVACLSLIPPAVSLDADHREGRDRHNAKIIALAFPELRDSDVSYCVEHVAEYADDPCTVDVIRGQNVVTLQFENVDDRVVYFEKTRRIGGQS
jgi:hypothetical protein